MAVVFTDTFTVGADIDLASYPSGSPDYAYIRNSGLTVLAASDDVRDAAASGVTVIARITDGAVPTGDQQCTVISRSQSTGNGNPMVRGDGTGGAQCYVLFRQNSTTLELARYDNGSFTSLTTFSGSGWNDNVDLTLGLRATNPNGSTVRLSAYVGGVQIGSSFDDTSGSRKTSGTPGIAIFNGGAGGDAVYVTSIEVDDLAAGGGGNAPRAAHNYRQKR